MSFGKLSQEDVDLQMQAVDPPSSLGAILPHEGTMYNIASTEIEGQISIEMRFSVTEDYYTNPKYLSNVRKYRKEAFEYLKSNGVDINAYTYIYTEPVLLDEFPKGKYYGQHDEEASIH